MIINEFKIITFLIRHQEHDLFVESFLVNINKATKERTSGNPEVKDVVLWQQRLIRPYFP
jgi:hypothetical protein